MNFLHYCVAFVAVFTHTLAIEITSKTKKGRNFDIKHNINNKTIETRPLKDNKQLDDLKESLKQNTIQSTKNKGRRNVKQHLDEYVMKRKITHFNLLVDTNKKLNRNMKQKVNNKKVDLNQDNFKERSVLRPFYEEPNVLDVLNTQKDLTDDKVMEDAKSSVLYYDKNNKTVLGMRHFKETAGHHPFYKANKDYKIHKTQRELTGQVVDYKDYKMHKRQRELTDQVDEYEEIDIKPHKENNVNFNRVNSAADYVPFFADPKVLNVLNTQTELMEKLMRVMEDERTNIRSYDKDFREMLEDLENRNATELSPNDMNKRITTTAVAKPAQGILQATDTFDRPKIFAALKKDPLVRRIIAMAKLKRKQFFEKLSTLTTKA